MMSLRDLVNPRFANTPEPTARACGCAQ